MASDERLTAAERRARVIQLRRSRVTFEEIGKALGISRQRAHKIYSDALRELPARDLAEHRAEELTLIDDALRALMIIAHDQGVHARTRVEAWNAARGWAERKARMLGLDAPTQHRIDVIDDAAVWAKLQEMAEEFDDLGRPEDARAIRAEIAAAG